MGNATWPKLLSTNTVVEAEVVVRRRSKKQKRETSWRAWTLHAVADAQNGLLRCLSAFSENSTHPRSHWHAVLNWPRLLIEPGRLFRLLRQAVTDPPDDDSMWLRS